MRHATIETVLTAAELDGFRTGDNDAVRAVYREYGRLVYAVAFRTLGSASLAEDATQQTFVKAWRAAPHFEPGRDLGPWLATIARNTALDMHRIQARRPTVSLAALPADDRTLAVSDPSIDRSFDVWAVRQAIQDLPAEERSVVQLQHMQGLTQVEVAEKLGVALGTIKSRSFRAHRHLAGSLAHLRGGPGDS